MYTSRSLGALAAAWLAVAVQAGCGGQGERSQPAGPVAQLRLENGPELVQNGDFAAGMTGWNTWLMNGGAADYAVKNGRAVVSIHASASDFSGIQLSTGTGFALEAGKTYRLTFTARGDASGTLRTSVWENGQDLNGDGFAWSAHQFDEHALGTAMARYTVDFTMTSSNGNAGLCFFMGDLTSRVYVDNVSLVEVRVPPLGTELVRNGTFGNDLARWDWYVSDGGQALFAVLDREAVIDVAAPAWTADGVQLRYVGGLPLVSDRSYRVSFRARAEAPGALTTAIWENGHDLDRDGSPWTSHGRLVSQLGTEMAQYTFDFHVPRTNLDAGLVFLAGQLTGRVYVDDVSVVEVPLPGRWERPPQPAPPTAEGLSYVEDAEHGATWFFADGVLLALYNNRGNTFPEFWVDGVNVIGGYAPVGTATNWGPPVKGHAGGYPYGQFDSGGFRYWEWEGFWSGYNYIDRRWGSWAGVNGNPGAVRSFDVQPTADGRLDVHVVTEVAAEGLPLYGCDVHYYVSKAGIGVRNDVTVLSDLEPSGQGDSGAQFLMTQADSDIDPDLPLDREQPDQYFQLALDGVVQDLDPYPPYGQYTPSVEYADMEWISPPYFQMHELPGGALVPADLPRSHLTVMGRRSREINLALRVDQARSRLPQLEYYCEINGFRDYLNFVYSAALGWNGPSVVPAGTQWTLYGDLMPWSGTDPETLRAIPMLSDGIP